MVIMHARKTEQAKKIYLVGTYEKLCHFIFSLDSEYQPIPHQTIWPILNIKLNGIHYEINPRIFEKYHVNYSVQVGFNKTKRDYLVPTTYICSETAGIIFCELTDDEKNAYLGSCLGKNKNIALIDHINKTSSAEGSLIKVENKEIDYDFIKKIYKQSKFLLFTFNNTSKKSHLSILNKDEKLCITYQFIKSAIKDNPATWHYYKKNPQQIEAKPEVIGRRSSIS